MRHLSPASLAKPTPPPSSSHPNIVHIHDIGEVDGSRFFSMEYVPGRSLADLVRLQGKLDPELAVGYTLQAARGLNMPTTAA